MSPTSPRGIMPTPIATRLRLRSKTPRPQACLPTMAAMAYQHRSAHGRRSWGTKLRPQHNLSWRAEKHSSEQPSDIFVFGYGKVKTCLKNGLFPPRSTSTGCFDLAAVVALNLAQRSASARTESKWHPVILLRPHATTLQATSRSNPFLQRRRPRRVIDHQKPERWRLPEQTHGPPV